MAGLTKTLNKLTEPAFNWASQWYRGIVGAQLKKYGLRYDDLYDPYYDLDVAEALKRLPQAEVDARNQRLKRAIDISMKHTHLPKELQEKQTPYEFYLQKELHKIKLEREERKALGSDMPYNRQIP
ncbi:hypothetical protein CLOM_g5495 [Closterium sp. NIES-68]|nr:hypothetical protein CLOM_g5495 [Closterium sp. NIES-68]GJP69342.1 hypothetical protein CLOP_g280 [Closterium sp. NIES-67]